LLMKGPRISVYCKDSCRDAADGFKHHGRAVVWVWFGKVASETDTTSTKDLTFKMVV
jgi:hypothetical protein